MMDGLVIDILTRYSLYWKAIGKYAKAEDDKYLLVLMEEIEKEVDRIVEENINKSVI